MNNTIKTIYSALFLITLLVFLGSPSAMACHKGVPHGKNVTDSCVEPPPADVPDVWANWGAYDPSPGILENGDRMCIATHVTMDGRSGNYDCEIKYEYFMFNFDLMDSSCLHNAGEDWLCEPYVSGGYQCPDDEYSFRWSGDCTSETGCEITIVNRFSKFGNYLAHLVDRMTLEAFGTVSESPTPNPFISAQAIEINEMHYTLFGGRGKGKKVLAKCGLEPTEEWPVTFNARPVE